MSTKIAGLTIHNVKAIIEVTDAFIDRFGFGVTTTQTTATFDATPQRVLVALDAIMADLPTQGHPRASLHAVRRKIVRLANG